MCIHRFGEVDKIEMLTNKDSPIGVTAVVSFLSLQIAVKISKQSHKIGNNALTIRFHDFSNKKPVALSKNTENQEIRFAAFRLF